MLEVMYYRVHDLFKDTWILTPTGDQQIIDLCKKNNWLYFEGSETDLVSRYYDFAVKHQKKNIIRLTSDCPMINTSIIKQMWNRFQTRHIDFMEFLTVDGWDVEICTFDVLEWLNQQSRYREHTFQHIRKHLLEFKQLFKYHSWREPLLTEWFPKLSVDTDSDFQNIRRYYEQTLGPQSI